MSPCASYIGWQGVWKTKRTTEFRNTASLRSVANPAKGINLLSPNFLTNFSSPDPFVKNSIDLSILHMYIRLSINNRIARANTFPSAEEASLLSVARRLSRLVVVHKADTFLQGSLNTCARRGYICRYPRPSLGRLSTPEHSPLEKVGRGGGYLGVLSVISLALLLPALSLPTHPSLPEP